jgi:hypothetical protein
MAVITSAGTGAWNTGATWVGGSKPADGDSVVIAAEHTVTFDANLAGDGIDLAGMTITGTLTATTTAGAYNLKCSGDIGGAGTFNIGSSGTPYPSTCTFTIDFDGTAKGFVGTNGLVLNFYCTQPTNKYVKLSAPEAIGQTELSVDTNLTADIWKAGDTVYICDVDAGLDAVSKVIAAGGIAATTLTITVALAAAKVTGAYIVLVTRNVKVTGSTIYVFTDIHGSVLRCEVSGCTNGMSGSYSNTVECVFSGGTRAFNNCYYNTITGYVIGYTSGLYQSYSNTISGLVAGCTRGFDGCYANTVSGSIVGCTSAFYNTYATTLSGSIIGCTNGLHYSYSNIVSGTISGTTYALYYSYTNIISGVITGATYGLYFSYSNVLYNSLVDATTELSNYTDAKNIPSSYTSSYDHDQVSGAFRSWTRGGITESNVVTVPPGYTKSYKMTCEDANNPVFQQEQVLIRPGETLKVIAYIKFADDHSAYKPRIQIVDCGADPLWGTGEAYLAEAQVASGTSTDWQTVTVEYENTNTIPMPVFMRTLAKRASGDVYFLRVRDYDYPAEGDVQNGTDYDFAALTGTFVAPAAGDVRRGTGYGAAGTEYTGTMFPGAVDNRYRYNY